MLVKVIVTTVLDPRMYTPPPCQIGQRNVDFHIRNLHWGDGLLRNGRGSKLGVTHIFGRVAENLAGLDSYSSA